MASPQMRKGGGNEGESEGTAESGSASTGGRAQPRLGRRDVRFCRGAVEVFRMPFLALRREARVAAGVEREFAGNVPQDARPFGDCTDVPGVVLHAFAIGNGVLLHGRVRHQVARQTPCRSDNDRCLVHVLIGMETLWPGQCGGGAESCSRIPGLVGKSACGARALLVRPLTTRRASQPEMNEDKRAGPLQPKWGMDAGRAWVRFGVSGRTDGKPARASPVGVHRLSFSPARAGRAGPHVPLFSVDLEPQTRAENNLPCRRLAVGMQLLFVRTRLGIGETNPRGQAGRCWGGK